MNGMIEICDGKVADKYIVHGCTYAQGAGNNLFSSSKYMLGLSGALLRV